MQVYNSLTLEDSSEIGEALLVKWKYFLCLHQYNLELGDFPTFQMGLVAGLNPGGTYCKKGPGYLVRIF